MKYPNNNETTPCSMLVIKEKRKILESDGWRGLNWTRTGVCYCKTTQKNKVKKKTLTANFDDETQSSCTMSLNWDNLHRKRP